jgi:hypothetical protein
LEEIKPLENPALAMSKKASVWWTNKQNQPKPQKRGGEKEAPEAVTTFYPDWENATMHPTEDNKIKIIVPLWRNIRAKYYYPTLRRAVFTLNADSSVANAQIIEIITRTDEMLTKYETQLFLNPDATNLKDFSGYVLEYDTQYIRTKFSGYIDGTLAKTDASIQIEGGGSGSAWDCGENNGNPSNPTNGNPSNPYTGSNLFGTGWTIWVGWITPPPPTGGNINPPPSGSASGSNTGGSNTGSGAQAQPGNTPCVLCSGGSGGGSGGSQTPKQLADVEADGGNNNGGGGGGIIRVIRGGDGGTATYWRPNNDVGDSRRSNPNPCGNSDEPDTSEETFDLNNVPDLNPNVLPPNMEDPDGVYRAYVTRLNEQKTILTQYLTNNTNGNLERKLKEIKTAITELDKLGKSTTQFRLERLTGNEQSGYTEYNPATGRVVIAMPNEFIINNGYKGSMLGIESHEFKHAYQFIRGRISFNRTTGSAGILYDLMDEVEAYERQYIIDSGIRYGQIDFYGNDVNANNYEITPSIVSNIGNAMTPPAYQNLPTSQITIFTKPQGRNLQLAQQNGTATDVFVRP